MSEPAQRRIGGLAMTEYASMNTGADGGPTLVLLHSLGLSRRTWAGPCRILGDQRRCLAIDVPGHGESARSRSFMTIQDTADAVVEAILADGVEKVVVVGNSMGATVAVAIADGHPDLDLVDSVVMVGAAVWENELDRREWMHSRSALFFDESGAIREPRAEFVTQVFGEYDEDRHRLMIEDQRNAAASIESSIWALYSYDIAAALSRLRLPVLAVYGDRDPYLGLSMPVISKFTATLSQATVVGGSHLLPVDKPSELAECLQRWVNSGYER